MVQSKSEGLGTRCASESKSESLMSKGRRWCPSSRRKNSLFLCLLVLSRPSVDQTIPSHEAEKEFCFLIIHLAVSGLSCDMQAQQCMGLGVSQHVGS